MKIERTHDMQIVKDILWNPKVFPHIHEDGIDEPDPIDHEGFYWLLISEDENPVGVFLVYARGAFCYEMHTCLLPEIWGGKSAKAAKLLGDYVFYEIGGKKLVTNVPQKNRLALRFATKNGMTVEGINKKSFMKDGVMHDQIFLGLTIEEWESCQ